MSDFNWNGFDATRAVEENPPRNYEPVPTGWYPTIVVDGEWKDTNGKTGPGRMLVLQAEIIYGPHKGSKCWTNANLVNNNPTARGIAEGFIGQLAVSAGVLRPRGHSELCRRPVMAKWTLIPDTDQYPAKNEIKEWKPIDKASTTAAPATHAEARSAQTSVVPEGYSPETKPAEAPDSNKKPWEK